MNRKLASLTVLLAIASSATAGTIEPTWAESVTTDYQDVNPRTGEPAVTTESQPYAGNGFYAESTASQYGRGTSYESLIDYQQPHGPVTLDVVLAYWGRPGSGVTDPIPLDVLAYPPSPTPPNLTSPPTGSLLEQIGLTPGSPASIEISPGSTGAECFLFEIDPGFPYHLGAPIVSGTVDPDAGSVPEPSSVVILATAVLAGLTVAVRHYAAPLAFRDGLSPRTPKTSTTAA